MTNKPKLRVPAFGISIDGYSAGLAPSLENPLGTIKRWNCRIRPFSFDTPVEVSCRPKVVPEGGTSCVLSVGYRWDWLRPGPPRLPE